MLWCKVRPSAFKFADIKMYVEEQEDWKRKTQPLVMQMLVFVQCPLQNFMVNAQISACQSQRVSVVFIYL